MQGPEMYTARALGLPFTIISVPRSTQSDHIIDHTDIPKIRLLVGGVRLLLFSLF